MTENDRFEQELERALAPRSAPEELRRWVARIPLENARGEGRAAPFWRRWLDGVSAPWAASMTAAVASLAVGFWLGFTGLVETTNSAYADTTDEDMVTLVFPSVPKNMGDVQ
jgi:hypothetical protein